MVVFIPLRFRKAGSAWCGGARETRWVTRHNMVTSNKTKEFLEFPCFFRSYLYNFNCTKSWNISCCTNNFVPNYACIFKKFFFVRYWPFRRFFNGSNGLIYLWIPRMSLIFEYVNWADLTGIRDTCVMGSATFPIRFSQTFVKLWCLLSDTLEISYSESCISWCSYSRYQNSPYLAFIKLPE